MELVAYMILGIFIGGLIVWFLAKARFQGIYTKQLAELEGNARSAEAVNAELRQQIQQRDTEINQIRNELGAEKQSKVEAHTRLEESQKNLDEQKSLLEAMKTEMSDTFNALSSAALKSSSEDFLRLASEHLGKVLTETKGKLGEHQAAMDGTIKPLQDMLKKYEEQFREIEKSRHESFGSLSQQIKSLSTMHEQLQRETSSLVTALRKPQVSGSWGQMSLRRAAELAGMAAHCDFYEQESILADSGRLRPDMIVRLPNSREIVVDAKAPVDAYMSAISKSSEEERQKALNNYVSQVRTHMNALGSKSYWDQFPKSPEIVVMYLPGESFFSAAIEHDHKLIEDSSIKKVILATPTTFIALLKAIAYGWQQEQITKNAQEISNLGKELYERIHTLVKHFVDIGSAIGKAMDSYNKVVGSMELRVLPSIRKFKELGVTGAEEIPVIEQIDKTPRSLSLLESSSDEDK
jgi:DNA recombination protein RmuC